MALPKPLKAIASPVPIPLAAVLTPLPADSITFPKLSITWDIVLFVSLVFFITSPNDSVAFFLNNLNGFNPLIKLSPLVANLIALREPTIPNNE